MIRSIMIVEIAGHPPEHISETLEKHVGALKSFKDINVNSIKMSEPKELEEQKGIFTCFAEVDFETENLSRLCDTIFDFMPSSVEILEPGKVSFTNQEASSLLNNISGRMHRYDEVARVAINKVRIMESELKKLQGDKDVKGENPLKLRIEKPKKTKKSKKVKNPKKLK